MSAHFHKYILILFIFVTTHHVGGQTIDKKICSTEAFKDECGQLARGGTLACEYYFHKVDCMIDVDVGKSHVGVVSAEEAFLGAPLLSDNVVVLGEVVGRYDPPQTVVIIRSSLNVNSLSELKSKRLCHPGFKHDNSFSSLMLQELELGVVNLDLEFCANSSSTLLEKHLHSLANFFGDSCRPGQWTWDDPQDKILKTRYQSLCNLCGPQKCDVSYDDPFEASLKCLKDNGADLAVSTLYEAQKFLNDTNNQQSFKYLCKDGKTSSQHCVWTSQLPKLILVNRGSQQLIRDYLQNNLGDKVIANGNIGRSTDLSPYLTKILELYKSKVNLLSSNKSLKQYVSEKRGTPPVLDNTTKKCSTTVKWCTSSVLENEKCKWLSQAALNKAIQPSLECVLSEDSNDTLSCIDAISRGSADITVALSDSAYITMKKDLIPIAYPETDSRNLSSILVVKRNDDSNINTLKDLKSKKACLPNFGGIEMLSFVRFTSEESKVCNYAKVFNDYVSSSCVPGVRSNIIKELTEDLDVDKLCSLCVPNKQVSTATYCNADSVNKYYGNEGAIRCLNESVGEFAVIRKPDVFTEDQNRFRVLCKNNKLYPSPGFNVNEDCALTIVSTSEVIAKRDNDKLNDIISALYEFEYSFGRDVNKPFYMFQMFNRTPDLLFRDSTPGIDFGVTNKYTDNYKTITDAARDCNLGAPGSAIRKKAAFICVFVFLLPILYGLF